MTWILTTASKNGSFRCIVRQLSLVSRNMAKLFVFLLALGSWRWMLDPDFQSTGTGLCSRMMTWLYPALQFAHLGESGRKATGRPFIYLHPLLNYEQQSHGVNTRTHSQLKVRCLIEWIGHCIGCREDDKSVCSLAGKPRAARLASMMHEFGACNAHRIAFFACHHV